MEILFYFLVGAFVFCLIGKMLKVSFYMLGVILLIALGSAVVNADDTDTVLGVALSNHSCGKVTKSMYMGSDAEGMQYYSAKCKNKKRYVVQVNVYSPKVSTRVLECSVAEMLGIKCFKRLTS